MAYQKAIREIDQQRREEARKKGLLHYDPWTPCIHGHVAKRLVANNQCYKCKQESRYKAPVRDKALYNETWEELIEEAKRKGMSYFFTGRPCKRGHVCGRYITTRVCMDCDREHWIKWAADNPEKDREVRRKAHAKYKANYPEKYKQAVRKSTLKWRTANWDRLREPNRLACLKHVHKKKAEHFGVPYEPQPCEICGTTYRPGMDHDHATGKFRGWLCTRCNSVLGYVKDSVEHLQKMIDYLNK